jgi:hypothetical protein
LNGFDNIASSLKFLYWIYTISYISLIMFIKSQIKNDLLHGVVKVKLVLWLYNFFILNQSHPSQYCIASNHISCSTFMNQVCY